VSQDVLGAFQIQDRVKIEIFSDLTSPLIVEGARVANLKLQGDHSGLGLEFTELSPKAKNLLALTDEDMKSSTRHSTASPVLTT